MRITVLTLIVLGLFFLSQGFVMPLVAERSDIESMEFQLIREGSSQLGIGLMLGAVACALLDRLPRRGSRGTAYPPQPPAQAPYAGGQFAGPAHPGPQFGGHAEQPGQYPGKSYPGQP